MMCSNGVCSNKQQIMRNQWSVHIELNETIDIADVDNDEILNDLKFITELEIEGWMIGTEMNEDGDVIVLVVLVGDDEEAARTIFQRVSKIDTNSEECWYGILCQRTNVFIVTKDGDRLMECIDGQYMNMTSETCVECNQMLGCATCSNGYSCDSCKEQFMQTSFGCIPICGAIHGEGCMKCTENKCLECTSKKCCDKMHHLWYDENNTCMDPAEKYGDGCVEANETDCTKCTAVTCCKKEEYFFKSKCHSCDVFGESCSKCIRSGCLECGLNETSGTTGQCMNCNSLFGQGCLTCGEFKCESADEGFVIVGTNAIECSALYGNGCSKCNADNGCDICPEGTIAIKGYCRNCSKVFGEGCSKCSSESCTECNGIMMNRACVGYSAAYGAGCTNCNNSGCNETDSEHFISNGFSFSCYILPNDTKPLRDCCLNRDNSLCSTESVIRSVRDNKKESIEAYYNMNQVIIGCNEMTPNCKTCGIEGDLAKCLECDVGYVLVGGTCKACNEHVNNGQCSECTLTGCSSCNGNSLAVSNMEHVFHVKKMKCLTQRAKLV